MFLPILALLTAIAAVAGAVILSCDGEATQTNQALAAGTETIIQQGLMTSVGTPTGKAVVLGQANYTLGAAATSMTLRIRQGNALTGTLVATSIIAVGAATFTQDSALVGGVDVLANVSGAQYCLTAQVAADVATIKSCSLQTTVLSG